MVYDELLSVVPVTRANLMISLTEKPPIDRDPFRCPLDMMMKAEKRKEILYSRQLL